MILCAAVRSIGVMTILVAVGPGAGCSVRTGLEAVESVVPPAQFHQAKRLGDFVDASWWKAFDDTTLNRLMAEVFDRNLSLQAALARYDQYSALFRAASANRLPQADVAAEASKSIDNANASDGSVNRSAWSIDVTTRYELDLWGKLSAGRQSSYADLLATQEDARTVALSISAQVASHYFTLVALRQQQGLLLETIDFYEDNVAFVEGRYRRGTATSLDLYQAQTVLADARAQLSVVDGEVILTEHALSVLLGHYPEAGWVTGAAELPKTLAPVALGLPADLVSRRPDVRAARYAMEAADSRTAEAIAKRLPGVSLITLLTGSTADGPVSPATLVARAFLGVAQPIFRGGALKADEDRARAVWGEALANYRLTLLAAFKEVEDALAQETSQLRTLGHLVNLEESSRESLRLATIQYLAGTADYLKVIISQTTHLSASRNVITARLGLVRHRVRLATALGGSWTDEALMRARSNPIAREATD